MSHTPGNCIECKEPIRGSHARHALGNMHIRCYNNLMDKLRKSKNTKGNRKNRKVKK